MAKTSIKSGCEFGRTNRIFIEDIQKNQGEILGGLNDIKKKNEEMFNHFTEKYEQMFEKAREKVPQWTTVIIGLLCTFVGGLAVWAFTRR
jgi:hypothetical protein